MYDTCTSVFAPTVPRVQANRVLASVLYSLRYACALIWILCLGTTAEEVSENVKYVYKSRFENTSTC